MRIALVGDLIIDKYFYATKKDNPEHINPCYKVIKQETKWGGAGNVNANLISLKLKVDFFHQYFPLSEKTRIICDGKYVCRIDEDGISKDDIEEDWNKYDYIIVSDYLKGAITKKLATAVLKSKAKVIVDTKPIHANWFKEAYLLKVNELEADQIFYDDNIFWKYQNVVVTYGQNGMTLYQRYWKEASVFRGIKTKVIDTTGAGDTVLATLTWALSKGKNLTEACILANKAGSISVQHLGCYQIKKSDLK